MKYTIVIVTFNRLDKLKKCIQCVEMQNIKANHIVIVDNASSDGTENFLNDEKFNNEKFIIKRMLENTGGSGGFYEGIKEALRLSDDWILLIDDDAMLRNDYIEQIMIHMDSTIFAYTGNVNEFGTISLEHRRRVSLKKLYKEYMINIDELKREFFDCDLASFCGLMIKTNLVRKIGLPHGDFFIWYDDTEYSLRLREFTKIRNVNGAILDHELTAYKADIENDHNMNWKVYYGLRNRLYTIKKYGNCFSIAHEIMIFIARFGKYFLWRISPNAKRRKIGNNNCKILKAALIDGICGKLGKNTEFLPGIK